MELVGISEAARALGRNKSTISRQVASGIIPNHGEPGKPLVNIEEARAAIAANVDRSKSSTPGLGVRSPDGMEHEQSKAVQPDLGLDDEDDYAPAAGADEQVSADKLSYNTARTALSAVQAKRAQMDYMRETGQLTPRVDVERAAEDHARILRDRLLGIAPQIGGMLATETDERKCAAIVSKAIKECLTDVIKYMEADPNGDSSHE